MFDRPNRQHDKCISDSITLVVHFGYFSGSKEIPLTIYSVYLVYRGKVTFHLFSAGLTFHIQVKDPAISSVGLISCFIALE
jgi:hypothetical protein